MKTKIIKFFACLVVSFFLVSSKGMAQQQQLNSASYPVHEQEVNGPGESTYTYILFVAPNKVYGYNIFRNGRIIFHQPAMAEPANKQPSITKKAQADKAATIAIQKIRRGMPGELSGEELMQATAQ